MAGKFELYKDKGGQFRFRLKAGNGENIGSSEGYKARASALNGIKSIKKNCTDAKRFHVFESKSKKWYFNLKAGNHQVILSSQGYSSKTGAEKGCASVTKSAPKAPIDDKT